MTRTLQHIATSISLHNIPDRLTYVKSVDRESGLRSRLAEWADYRTEVPHSCSLMHAIPVVEVAISTEGKQ
jgi:hypothetical protein